jgi:site-specific DNA-methyltransferase (adenine-specific)
MMKPYFDDGLVTLYHGDALEVSEWLSADVLVTDPPYGMAYVSGRRKQLAIIGDESLSARDDALKLWGEKPALVFGTWKQPRPNNVRQLIVWDKRGGAGFSGDLNMPWADITEEIYVLGQGWVGRRRPAIYSIPTLPPANRPDHPTPKPVSLIQHLLDCCPAGVIADPFAGSGATLIAARNLGRKVIGVELEEKYCELIANRLSQQVFDFGSLDA